MRLIENEAGPVRASVTLDQGGSTIIPLHLVNEVLNKGGHLSVRYGSTRIFIRENYTEFDEAVKKARKDFYGETQPD